MKKDEKGLLVCGYVMNFHDISGRSINYLPRFMTVRRVGGSPSLSEMVLQDALLENSLFHSWRLGIAKPSIIQ